MPPEGEAKSTWVNLTTFKAPVVDGTAGVDGFDGGDTGVSDDDEEGLVDTAGGLLSGGIVRTLGVGLEVPAQPLTSTTSTTSTTISRRRMALPSSGVESIVSPVGPLRTCRGRSGGPLYQQHLEQPPKGAELPAHVAGVAGGPAQNERALEGDEHVVGQGFGVQVGIGRQCRPQQVGDGLASGHDGGGDLAGRATLDQSALGEHRHVQAARLRRHQVVGSLFEHPDELDHPFGRVVGVGDDLSDRGVQMGELDLTGYVTDGGLETDLIFNHGVDLPEFAAFPLLDDADGRALLRQYYDGYAQVAETAGAGLLLESPTWRANTDSGALVGYDQAAARPRQRRGHAVHA